MLILSACASAVCAGHLLGSVSTMLVMVWPMSLVPSRLSQAKTARSQIPARKRS